MPADAHDARALPADARGLCQLMLMMRGLLPADARGLCQLMLKMRGFPADAYSLPADGHDARALPADAQLMLMMRELCWLLLADFAS